MNTVSPGGASSAPSPDFLAALDGDTAAGSEIYRESFSRLARLARRYAPDLASDLHEEIVQETWQLAYARGSKAFINAGVEPRAYLKQVLRNAVEMVRSNNRPPGSTSRAARGRGRVVSEEYSEMMETTEAQRRFDVAQRGMETRMDVAAFVATLEPVVATAFGFILTRGLTMTQAAHEVGLTRQTLGRRLQGLRPAA